MCSDLPAELPPCTKTARGGISPPNKHLWHAHTFQSKGIYIFIRNYTSPFIFIVTQLGEIWCGKCRMNIITRESDWTFPSAHQAHLWADLPTLWQGLPLLSSGFRGEKKKKAIYFCHDILWISQQKKDTHCRFLVSHRWCQTPFVLQTGGEL